VNDAAECQFRQRRCLEFVDAEVAPLLALFESAAVIVCADHGDCWGEDGLWEHGIPHEKAFEVPLLFRLPAAQGGSAIS
jgi:glucan phosphoethanolaminetransferase (alkaline phosphatase superfamily)